MDTTSNVNGTYVKFGTFDIAKYSVLRKLHKHTHIHILNDVLVIGRICGLSSIDQLSD